MGRRRLPQDTRAALRVRPSEWPRWDLNSNEAGMCHASVMLMRLVQEVTSGITLALPVFLGGSVGGSIEPST
jgi:hypothetical protein